ncbi:hypothetical protein ACJ41O_012086 [Fusarium nematophilum]
MDKHKKFLKGIATANSSLTHEIDQLASSAQDEQPSVATKHLLSKLYDTLVSLSENRGHPRTPNKAIFEAYASFLEPIHALSRFPNGDFLSARMILYLASALVSEDSLDLRFPKASAKRNINLLRELFLTLDDALLGHLRIIWSASDKSEEFNWAFTDYPVQRDMSEDSDNDSSKPWELAQALSARELVHAGGIQGKRYYYAAPGGSRHKKEPDWKLYTGDIRDVGRVEAKRILWKSDLGQVDDGKLQWKSEGSDGPIRESICVTIQDGNGGDTQDWLNILRRSRQFVFDAREIARPNVAKEKQGLAQQAMVKAGLPVEISLMALEHLEEPRPPHPYLSKIKDLSKEYLLFPETQGRCASCEGQKDQTIKHTCPTASIWVWNLALRAFHVFHKGRTAAWQMCKHGSRCTGHHDNGGWQVSNEQHFTNHVNALLTDQAGTTTDCAYFKPFETIICDTKELDVERRKKYFSWRDPFQDSVSELEMSGGAGGLIDVLLHNRVHLGGWRGQRVGDGGGHFSTAAQWALGRSPAEEDIARKVIEELHSGQRCRYC